MASLPHKTGRYRAYKKIQGREYQQYFHTQEEADAAQRKLDALASLKPDKAFNEDGSMVGVTLRLRRRTGRPARITMRIQLNGQQKEVTYTGAFEGFWKEVMANWKALRGLHQVSYAGYATDIRQAKRFYIQALSELEGAISKDESAA